MRDLLPVDPSDPEAGDRPPFDESLIEALAIAQAQGLQLELIGWALGTAVRIARKHPELAPVDVIHQAVAEALAEWDL